MLRACRNRQKFKIAPIVLLKGGSAGGANEERQERTNRNCKEIDG